MGSWSSCSLSIPLSAISIPLPGKSSFQLHLTPISLPGKGCCPAPEPRERCSSVPGASVNPAAPALAVAVPQTLLLAQQKHQIQVTLGIISSRKEFIWVWVRKSVPCWLPDPLSGPDLFIKIAQPAKYLTPGIRGSLSCKKDLRRWDRKRKHFGSLCQALEICY